MPIIPETIKTDVDSLIEFIKKKKECSFEEISKNLNLPLSTVEAWANFLEEEKVVSIKYRFTTPYLVYIEMPVIKEPKEIVGDVSKLLQDIQGNITNKQFSEAKIRHSAIKAHIKSLPSKFVDENSEIVSNLHKLESELYETIANFDTKKNYDTHLNKYIKKHKEFNQELSNLKEVMEKTTSMIRQQPINEEKEEARTPQLADVDVLLKKAYRQIEANELDMLKDLYPKIHTKLKVLNTQLKEKYGEEMSIGAGLEKDISKTDTLLGEAREHIRNEEYQEAKEKFMQVHSLLKKMHSQLKIYYEEKNIIEKEVAAKEELADIEPLFKKAYDYMTGGKYDLAKEVYTQIENKYMMLPKSFIEKKETLKKDIVKLNRDLALNIGSYSEKQIIIDSKKIESLVREAVSCLQKNDIVDANGKYSEIEVLYRGLPSGFIDKKTQLQKIVLGLQEKIILKKQQLIKYDFDRKSSEITRTAAEIKKLIQQEKIDSAYKLYTSIKTIFNQLPDGFLEQKTILEDALADIEKDLSHNKKRISEIEMNEKSKKIEAMLKSIKEAVDKNNMFEANRIYDNMQDIYSSMPSGFLEKKTILQDSILRICEELGAKLDKITSSDFNAKYEKLTKQLTAVESYAKSGQIDLASALYEEIVSLYNRLPSGFLEKKTELRSRVLNVYRQIMLGADSMYLEKADEITKNKYMALLKILIKIHQYIEEKHFNLIEINYKHMLSIYNEMPIGFLQKNIRIRDEIIRVYNELLLYKKAEELDRIAKENNAEKLRMQLDDISALYNQLSKERFEDVALFGYIDEKRLAYSKLTDKEKQTVVEEKPMQLIKETAPEAKVISLPPLPQEAQLTQAADTLKKKLNQTKESIYSLNIAYIEPVKLQRS